MSEGSAVAKVAQNTGVYKPSISSFFGLKNDKEWLCLHTKRDSMLLAYGSPLIGLCTPFALNLLSDELGSGFLWWALIIVCASFGILMCTNFVNYSMVDDSELNELENLYAEKHMDMLNQLNVDQGFVLYGQLKATEDIAKKGD